MSRPSPASSQRLFTTKQTLVYLGVCQRTLWTMTNSGEIASVRFGAGRRKSVRYDVRDLDAWIEAKKGGTR